MRRWLFIAAALALVLSVGGTGAALAQQDRARLRAVHAVPDAPPVDVLVDGNVVFGNLPYKTITPYGTLSAGTHQVQVVAAGTRQPALIDTTVDLRAGTDNTFLAVGRLASIQPLVLLDDNTLPPAGQAKVRFVHASPNAPPVDVAVKGGPVLFSNVPFTGVGNYATVNAGRVDLEVREADAELATPTVSGSLLLTVPNVTFSERTVYTVYAVGLLNEQPPLEAIISVDATPAPPPAVGAAATPTSTPTRLPRTATPTVTPSQTPSPTPSPTPSATPSATPTEVVSPTATGVVSPSPTGAVSPTATGVASPSPTGAASPSPAAGASPSPVAATPTGAPVSPEFASPTP